MLRCEVVGKIVARMTLSAGVLLAACAAPPRGEPALRATQTNAAGQPGADVVRVDVAENGIGGWPVYRIPALAVSNRGTLLAAYDGRPSLADLPAHIAVLLRRSIDGGRTWQARQVVRDGPAPQGFGAPSLLVDRDTGRIFLFYSAAVNNGIRKSARGNDPTNPNLAQADVSWSDDDGLTWQSRRLTAEIRDPSWWGGFFSSGQGIQLTQGPHKGRLLQQYAVQVGDEDHARQQLRAVSIYSDDHGETWHAGQPVGPGMDENKVVELADGTLLLNSRPKGAGKARLVAHSHDGGIHYDAPAPDRQLPDPGNNASIIRVAPRADDARAHWLLFSNTASIHQRRNLTLRLSCDDGRTWPRSRVLDAGSAAYSTLAMLPGGDIGLLYERDDYRYLTFARIDKQWLAAGCAEVSPTRSR